MPDLTDSSREASSAPPGPPSDYLPVAPQTLRVPGPPLVPSPPVAIPGYDILGELGRGGVGVVYKARHHGLNRLVALKVLLGGPFAGPTDRARFRHEAEAAARVHHPNVVQVYDVGEYAGVGYIAFEFIDGPTLRRWQDGKPADPRLAAGVAAQVARAVQHAHDSGIVHRDLKPANILLAETAGKSASGSAPAASPSRLTQPATAAKVTDFGLAKSVGNGADLTATGMACGTPNYMAPEQVRGGPAGSHPAVDVWGIGAVLFELLTGRPPFTGTDAAAIMRDILQCEPPPVRRFAPKVPRDLEVIVGKCLEKNPARRYLSPADVAADLERFLRGEPILARPAGTLHRLTRWAGRNPTAAALGVVLLLGLAGVSAFAVALSRSFDREHAARVEEARHRREADEATRDALAARDETRDALHERERALGKLRDEKERAEQNLALAEQAIDHVLAVAMANEPSERPELYPVYHQLLAGLDPFVGRIAAQKGGDEAFRAKQAVRLHSLGVVESNMGRQEAAAAHLRLTAERFRELARDYPDNPRYLFDLGQSLGTAGSVARELRQPDADALLGEALAVLDRHRPAAGEEAVKYRALIGVHLSMSTAEGDDSSREHDLVVLELADRAAAAAGDSSELTKVRAHALNNIASDLTNRGKTDEAETYWLRVLELREALVRGAPADRIARYELAKCLFNYSNQLGKTERPDESFRARQRAAGLFDALRDDAKLRTTYVTAMVRNDTVLADEYARRGELPKAVERLTRVIDLNGVMVERNPGSAVLRGTQADAHTTRAELSAALGRHADAARDYRDAVRLSTKASHAEFCSAKLVAALVAAGDRAGAVAAAEKLDPEKFTHPVPCVELARSWLAVARAAGEDAALSLAERTRAADGAIGQARAAVRAAQKKGFGQTPDAVRWFHAQKEFAPLHDLVPRDPK